MLDKTDGKLMFSDKTYDVIKQLVQVILPAFSALYFGLAAIWGLPAAEQVVGTIALFTTFLGVCLGISHTRYENSDDRHDGTMTVFEDPEGGKTLSLDLQRPPEEMVGKKVISFKVDPHVVIGPPIVEE